MSDVLFKKAVKKYKTVKQVNRRLATIERHLAKNLEKMLNLRPDERTQRKVAIHAKRDELTQEMIRLQDVRSMLELDMVILEDKKDD